MINMNKKLILNDSTSYIRRNTSDLFPVMRTKIFLPNPEKEPNKKPPHLKQKQFTQFPRYNQIGVQMLPRKIYDHVFPGRANTECKSKDILAQCKKDLLKHNMITSKENTITEPDLELPPLRGENIEEHFRIIGEEQAKPYQNLVLQLLKGIPRMPEQWVMQEGWTRYEEGKEPYKVEFPLEEIMVFDIEVSKCIY